MSDKNKHCDRHKETILIDSSIIQQLAFRITNQAIKDGQHLALGVSSEALLEMTRYNLLHMSPAAVKEQARWLKKIEKKQVGRPLHTLSNDQMKTASVSQFMPKRQKDGPLK